jgi:hypothetical protein
MSTFLYSAVTHACSNRIRNAQNRARLLQQHLAGARQIEPGTSPEQLAALRWASAFNRRERRRAATCGGLLQRSFGARDGSE